MFSKNRIPYLHVCYRFSDPTLHKMGQRANMGDRRKRATVDVEACNLFMQSDTMLWDRMTKPKSENGLGYVSLYHSQRHIVIYLAVF